MRPKIKTDEQLLAAARSAFIEFGGAVSTTVIAENAGVSQATLFKRFGTKEQLMKRALGTDAIEPLIDLALVLAFVRLAVAAGAV